jgi:hypothetical protein
MIHAKIKIPWHVSPQVDTGPLGMICFVCLFIAPWAIFQLSGGCHNYRWQGCKFRPMLSIHGFWQWGFFFVPNLLRHGTSVYIVSSEGPAHTSDSGIQTEDARITRFLRLHSNHCAMRAALMIFRWCKMLRFNIYT